MKKLPCLKSELTDLDCLVSEIEGTLHPWQQEHLEALTWLFSEENRGEGRTHLMALVMIRLAISNPDQWIRVFDHSVFAYSNSHVLQDTIWRMLSKHKALFRFKESSFMFCSPTKE